MKKRYVLKIKVCSGLSLYHWKFLTKESFTLVNSVKLGHTPWKKSKMKTYCMEIQRIFYINPGIMKISLFFQLTTGISIDIFSISITIQCLPYIYIPISIIYIYIWILISNRYCQTV